MGSLVTLLKIAGYLLLGVWLFIAFVMGWQWMWFRRPTLNASLSAAHQEYGEEFHPVGRLRWIWIIIQSVPMLLFLAFIGVVIFLFHIPGAVFCLITGKPPSKGYPPDFDNGPI